MGKQRQLMMLEEKVGEKEQKIGGNFFKNMKGN